MFPSLLFEKACKIITTVIKKGLNGDIFTKKTCLQSEILIIIVKYNIGFNVFLNKYFVASFFDYFNTIYSIF
jgi:hypothetical protein